MLRPLWAALALLAACSGPEPAPIRKSQAAPPPAAEAAAPVPAPDPLVEAMALLKAAKDDPQDGEAGQKAAAAFLALERDARLRGNAEAAARYHQVAADLDPLGAEAAAQSAEEPAAGPGLDSVVVQEPSGAPAPDAPMDGLRLGTYHFSVRISGTRVARSADAVLGVLEDAYLKVCGAMAVNPDGKVPVVLYTDREFQAQTGLPEWVAGAYDGTIHLPMAGLDASAPRARNVITHEFVHAFNHQVAKGRAPLWLEEGLAQYFEDPRPRIDVAALLAASRRGGLPPITSPSFIAGGQGQASLLYPMALSTVLCLEDRASLAAVSTFLQALGAGTPVAQAFQDTFLFPYDRLQGETIQWLGHKQR